MQRKPTKRVAGRPDKRHKVGREGLISATLDMLRHTAPDDLTLLDIATRVGVDPALIRYYFGNKEGLLREATFHLMDSIQALGEAMPEALSVPAMVRARVESIVEVGRQNPHFLQLVMREIYGANDRGGAADGAASSYLEQTARRGVALSETMLAARQEGEGLPDLDARFLHVALVGAATFFATAQPLFEVLFAGEDDQDALAGRYVDFLTDMLLRGMGVNPAGGRPGL